MFHIRFVLLHSLKGQGFFTKFAENFYSMKKLASILLVSSAATATLAQDATFSYFKYEGSDPRFDKTIDPRNEFTNPVIEGFYPDPSVTRKGDTYYLVNSTFAFFPGVPIFKSKDLVNWEQIGHVLDRESQLHLEGLGASEGIYAPAISYNPYNDTFYMITTLVGKGGNFFVKTKDPLNGWSDPIWLGEIDGIDPSFLFDSDGKAYIVHNAPVVGTAEYEGERAIRLLEFDVNTDKIIGEPIEIVRRGTHVRPNPIWIEGPHLYHIGDWYYLMCAEGGTAEDHSEVMFRARNPKGPWEEAPNNPILTQRDLADGRINPVTCTGHADMIQTPEGEWWAVFLGCRPYEANMYNTGRETFLLPVEWNDGWPVILPPGTPVPTVVPKKDLSSQNENLISGNFSYIDRFEGETLNSRWIFFRNAPENFYTLTEKGLVIHPVSGTINTREALSALFARQQHPNFCVETEVDFAPISSNQLAGLALTQSEKHNFAFGKTLIDGKPSVVLHRTEGADTLIASVPVPLESPVRLKVNGNGRYYSFYFQLPGQQDWTPLATGVDASNLSTAKAGGFIGTVIGPYATIGK